ncbi:unnamed protein product, partial [Ectocarpus sp. 12 AP-2014]
DGGAFRVENLTPSCSSSVIPCCRPAGIVHSCVFREGCHLYCSAIVATRGRVSLAARRLWTPRTCRTTSHLFVGCPGAESTPFTLVGGILPQTFPRFLPTFFSCFFVFA